MSKSCLIFFTKSPELGKCKTRLNDFLSLKKARDLQIYLIQKNFNVVKNFEFFIYYSGDLKELQNTFLNLNSYIFKKQFGKNIGEKMKNALLETLNLGYEKVILIGSDLDNLEKVDIKNAFLNLDKFDLVFSPSKDGGYSLIGLKKMVDEIFDIKFSTENVLINTLKILDSKNLSYKLGKTINDIDTKFDIISKFTKSDEISFLASGEYNSNYLFKKGKNEYIFRVNHASQMNLDNQIIYEFKALKILESSGVTPKAYEVFKKSYFLPNGALVMEFLKGRALDYKKDLDKVAFILSKIHTLKIPKNCHLIVAKKPFLAIYNECKNMSSIYLNSKFKDKKVCDFLNFIFEICENLGLDDEISNKAIVNTELNSSNFIIGKNSSYLIDWEKPLISDKEQDLGHFLAPTTTYFKSDDILSFDKINSFLDEYEKNSSINRDLVKKYIKFNCLRGISWCAMASVAHQNKNAPQNPKIKLFLKDSFLEKVNNFLEMR
ncbi:DUF2064 domain-containing protein [Campylobacter sp. FMV-PI01]|uniref:DUF2064 domain-containing protein n=1 Tax=Campylobacter portucalensis TaxID=2608384 RepID=A0A6L5WFY9_9BACT|nr:TIGR04282 family arsenosugar biosynthesis glycosyltransferase [Campylobacter portucalensis]MSN96040.1 DUF2064 domain-containing protein [Campylobacter portucalensis]